MRKHAQRVAGFTVTELMVVLVVFALLGTAIAQWVAGKERDDRGKSVGESLAAVHNALEDYGRTYRDELISTVSSTPKTVTGVAVITAPTPDELFALGHLTVRVNPQVARAGTIRERVDVVPAGCVPPSCSLGYLSYIDGPMMEMQVNRVANRVLDAATRAAGGRAGTSEAFAPDRLRGQSGQWDAPNPVPGTVGIFALVSSSSSLGEGKWVRQYDDRHIFLQDSLTVANTVAAGTLTVANTAAVGGTMTVGGVLNSNSLNVTSTVSVLGTSTFAGPVNVNNNLQVSGSVSVQQNITATGSITGDRLIPRGTYALLSACPATEEGAIANRLGGNGMVVCLSGFWRSLASQAREGDACAPEGTRATDPTDQGLVCIGGAYRGLRNLWRAGTPGQSCTAAGVTGIDFASNNETLLCRANPGDPSAVLLWFRLRDLTSHLQFQTAVTVVGDGALISKPTCSAAATGAAPQPLLQLTPKAYSSDDGGYHVYGEHYSATQWVARFRDGSGAIQPGQPSAIAEVYCYYP